MDTRLRARMGAGGSRLHYQQFDYSTFDRERAPSEDVLSDAPDHSEAKPPARLETLMLPDEQPLSSEHANVDNLLLFAQHGVVQELSQTQDATTATTEAEVSLAGTSAPLFTNPSLADVPPLPDGTSNLLDTEARKTGLSSSDELAARHNVSITLGRGRPLAALSRSTQATNSQYLDLRLRAQRRGR